MGPKRSEIHHGYWPRAHGKDVAQNSAYAGGCALKRLNEGRMIVRLDLESAGPAIADVDDARIFPGTLHYAAAARGQALQVNARRFIGTMLAPHHAEDPQFGERGLTAAQQLPGASRIPLS